ncbi:molybdenum cofactor biosynthesis protein B [Phocicoccus pinnipedialis]|uniref:Molybdenum cofactor biosynthesis protein B n=1 Tax=Phocicoccus pinnipedialis TaxID=110845 RepID=A0A6V7R0U3_9BACL|nr:molybdenum cofactor biosynthesis protein B [Jeotgalicoccus pinnipedialis]MBP1938741.1 molybdenum cofactor biosynthesis protein B [Jeotgalicoccus pinnipedialis]CAD2070592.1 Molybdenum cofactor biosynthesis protein B [Jeotgalicoccus pinnipedialis]
MSIIQKIDRNIEVGIITVSDTRTQETDKGGNLIYDYLTNGDLNTVVLDKHRKIVKDSVSDIRGMITMMLEDVDVVITTGGTGIAKRDVTIEAVQYFFHKEVEGFGELFRMLSYTEDIGSRSLLSRAIMGTHHNKLIVSLPGSTGAIKLGMEKLILKELNHLVYELNKDA